MERSIEVDGHADVGETDRPSEVPKICYSFQFMPCLRLRLGGR